MTRQTHRRAAVLRITKHESRITCIICLLFSACSPKPTNVSTEFLALGTTVSIAIAEDSERARQAAAEARAELQRIGNEWYPWAKDGELVRLNAALASGLEFRASQELTQLLTRSREYVRLSDGAFDPGVGRLVQLWGFDSGERAATHPPPSDDALNAWRRDPPSLAVVQIEGGAVRSQRRDVLIDLGAIGKGAAVDRAVEILRAHGVQHALINAGGNLRAIGRNVDHPWRVAIRDPRGDQPIAWLELANDESVSTSGDYERFALSAGRRIHHLLDPRTGSPAVHTQAITVIARDATLADAASTALFIAGPEAWQSVALRMRVRQVLRIDANGRIEATQELISRLRTTAQDREIFGVELVAEAR